MNISEPTYTDEDVRLVFTNRKSFLLAHKHLVSNGFPEDPNYGDTFEDCLRYSNNKDKLIMIVLYWKDFCMYRYNKFCDEITTDKIIVVTDDWEPPNV